MFAASFTYAPQPNRGGEVTASEYDHIRAIDMHAPRLFSCLEENGYFTVQSLS